MSSTNNMSSIFFKTKNKSNLSEGKSQTSNLKRINEPPIPSKKNFSFSKLDFQGNIYQKTKPLISSKISTSSSNNNRNSDSLSKSKSRSMIDISMNQLIKVFHKTKPEPNDEFETNKSTKPVVSRKNNSSFLFTSKEKFTFNKKPSKLYVESLKDEFVYITNDDDYKRYQEADKISPTLSNTKFSAIIPNNNQTEFEKNKQIENTIAINSNAQQYGKNVEINSNQNLNKSIFNKFTRKFEPNNNKSKDINLNHINESFDSSLNFEDDNNSILFINLQKKIISERKNELLLNSCNNISISENCQNKIKYPSPKTPKTYNSFIKGDKFNSNDVSNIESFSNLNLDSHIEQIFENKIKIKNIYSLENINDEFNKGLNTYMEGTIQLNPDTNVQQKSLDILPENYLKSLKTFRDPENYAKNHRNLKDPEKHLIKKEIRNSGNHLNVKEIKEQGHHLNIKGARDSEYYFKNQLNIETLDGPENNLNMKETKDPELVNHLNIEKIKDLENNPTFNEKRYPENQRNIKEIINPEKQIKHSNSDKKLFNDDSHFKLSITNNSKAISDLNYVHNLSMLTNNSSYNGSLELEINPPRNSNVQNKSNPPDEAKRHQHHNEQQHLNKHQYHNKYQHHTVGRSVSLRIDNSEGSMNNNFNDESDNLGPMNEKQFSLAYFLTRVRNLDAGRIDDPSPLERNMFDNVLSLKHVPVMLPEKYENNTKKDISSTDFSQNSNFIEGSNIINQKARLSVTEIVDTFRTNVLMDDQTDYTDIFTALKWIILELQKIKERDRVLFRNFLALGSCLHRVMGTNGSATIDPENITLRNESKKNYLDHYASPNSKMHGFRDQDNGDKRINRLSCLTESLLSPEPNIRNSLIFPNNNSSHFQVPKPETQHCKTESHSENYDCISSGIAASTNENTIKGLATSSQSHIDKFALTFKEEKKINLSTSSFNEIKIPLNAFKNQTEKIFSSTKNNSIIFMDVKNYESGKSFLFNNSSTKFNDRTLNISSIENDSHI